MRLIIINVWFDIISIFLKFAREWNHSHGGFVQGGDIYFYNLIDCDTHQLPYLPILQCALQDINFILNGKGDLNMATPSKDSMFWTTNFSQLTISKASK